MMTNPFFHRGPIRIIDYFVGRYSEIQSISNLLRLRQSVAVHGQRRFGKTSLLFHIVETSTSKQHDENIRWIYIDGGTLDGLNEDWLYGNILSEIQGNFQQVPYAHFVNVLRTLADSSLLIIILDEFELIAANPHFGPTLFNRLRGLTAQFSICFVTISKNPLAQLTFAHPHTLSSPFFNIFASQRLSTFTRDESTDLLVKLSEYGGKPFSDETIEFILNLVGYHPLFLQIAGFHVYPQVEDGYLSTEAQREIKHHVRVGLEGHLQYYWNNLNSDEQYQLVASSTRLSQTGTLSDSIRESGFTYDGNALSEVATTFLQSQSISGILKQGSITMDIQHGVVIINSRPVSLTQTEFALLRYFVENAGQILSSDEIEAALWPDEIAVDPERVRGIVKRLRASLGDAGEMIANRRGQGYFINID